MGSLVMHVEAYCLLAAVAGGSQGAFIAYSSRGVLHCAENQYFSDPLPDRLAP